MASGLPRCTAQFWTLCAQAGRLLGPFPERGRRVAALGVGPWDPEGAGSPGAAARAPKWPCKAWPARLPLLVSGQLAVGFPALGAKAATWKTDVAAAGPDCAPSEAFGQQ